MKKKHIARAIFLLGAMIGIGIWYFMPTYSLIGRISFWTSIFIVYILTFGEYIGPFFKILFERKKKQ